MWPAWDDPLDPNYAKGYGGRWNPPDSFPTLYFNEDLVQCSMLDDFHQPSVVDGIEESTDVRVEYPVLYQNSALLK